MDPITSKELVAIEQKLTDIEQKIGGRWAIPVIVALISGTIGIATVFVQVYLEQEGTKKRMLLEQNLLEESAKTRLTLEQDINFYNNVISHLVDIDEAFREACFSSALRNRGGLKKTLNNKLTDSLLEYRKLIERYRFNYDPEFFKRLKGYNEFIADNFFTIDKPKIQETEKKSIYEKSKSDFRNIEDTLQQFFNERIKPRQRA